MAGKKGRHELEIVISGDTDKSLSTSIRRARKELTALERQSGLAKRAIGDSFGGMSVKGIDSLGKLSDDVFGGVIKGGAMAAAAMAGISIASAKVGMDFESQMSTVQAISQASAGDMKQLTEIAKEMGETTQFTATEAGQGLEYMAMAGWKTKDMLSGLPGIMYLAAASGEELGAVSDIVTDALTAFGLQASDSAHFSDVLAQASSSSNTNVAMMGETFQYVAPIAGSFGYTIEDVAIATGLMANAGIKGEKAGTAMRTMLTNLAKPTKQMQGYMDELSLSLVDSNGNMKPLRQQMGELRNQFTNLTEAQRAEYAAGIAGKEGMSGLLAMVNASDADFDKLAVAIDNSSGAAKKMSEIRLDNLQGDLTLLSSAAQGVGVELFGGFSDGLRSLTQGATDWVVGFADDLEENIPTAKRLMKEFGAGMTEFFGPVIDIGKWFIDNPEVVKGGITGITAALLTFKGFKLAKDGLKLLTSLSGMVTAWPVVATGAVIGGIVGIGTAIGEADKRAAEQNLAEHFGDISLSIKELKEAARNSLGDDLFNSLDAFGEASDKSSELYGSMQNNIKELKKASWKVSLGIDFDETDEATYMQTVDLYVKNAQEYISNKGYELKLAVDIVMGESPDKQGLMDGNNQFYSSLDSQISDIKTRMQASLARADDWGLSFQDKEKIVQKYLSDIAEITQMVSDAENAAKVQAIQGKYSGMNMLDVDTFQNFQQDMSEYESTAIQKTDEAYETVLASLNAQRIAGDKGIEGGISQQVFDEQSNEATKRYYESKAQIITDGYKVMRDTIISAYGDEVGPAMDIVNQKMQEKIPEIMENPNITSPEDFRQSLQFVVNEALDSVEIPPDAKGAIRELLEGMGPTEEMMSALKQQITTAGGEIPQTLMDAMTDMEALSALSGDEEDMWGIIGAQISNSPEYSLLLETVQQQGGGIPDAAIDAIRGKYDDVEGVARGFLGVMRDTLQEGISATVPVSIKTIMSVEGQSAIKELDDDPGNGIKIGARARGGIVTKPELSWIAEAGSPEAVIPLDGSRHAMELWQETGKLLGAYENNNYGRLYDSMVTSSSSVMNNNSSSFAPVFSPVIQVGGGAGVKEEVMSGLQMSYEQFKDFCEQYNRERDRVAL